MRYYLLLLCLLPLSIQSQHILPSLDGEELKLALVANYKPGLLMNYNTTRDTMYREVYRDQDGYVTCYYTGHSIYLPLDVDPSAFLYDNENPDGITAEHIYPQSKGAKYDNPKSDMHSLFPAIWRVNEARSNYPFAEVPDDETDHWYYRTEDSEVIPTNNIDQYSERLNGGWGTPGKFEPRESVKGDVARAVFYFFTMYQEEALDADPLFFEGMKDILIEWHDADPVDETEERLNKRKAVYQNDKENPYILDCTLVHRVFEAELSSDIECPGFSHTKEQFANDLTLYPNPVQEYLYLDGSHDFSSVSIRDLLGNTVYSAKAHHSQTIDISGLAPGQYFLIASKDRITATTKRFIKL